MQNIITAVFKKKSEGFQAITELRQQPVSEKSVVLQAVLVEREEKGIEILDRYDSGILTSSNTALGGIVGSLLGILGGPVGVLLMGSAGVFMGSVADSGNMIGGEAMLETVAGKLMEGEAALVILASEEDEAVLDAKLSKFDGEIARFDAAVVAEEVEEAVKVESEMARQAAYELRKTKLDDHKKAIEDKREKFAAEIDDQKALIAEKADKFADKVDSKVDEMDDKIEKFADKIADKLEDKADAFEDKAEEFADKVADKFGDAKEAIGEKADELTDKFAEYTVDNPSIK